MIANTMPTKTVIHVERYLMGFSSVKTRYAAAILPALYPMKMAPEVTAFFVAPAVLLDAMVRRST